MFAIRGLLEWPPKREQLCIACQLPKRRSPFFECCSWLRHGKLVGVARDVGGCDGPSAGIGTTPRAPMPDGCRGHREADAALTPTSRRVGARRDAAGAKTGCTSRLGRSNHFQDHNQPGHRAGFFIWRFYMVDFNQETRKRCRHCKMRLPEPTSNERQAFCTRGCYNSFYLHKCRACEKPIEQPKRGTRFLCKKPKCHSAWQHKDGMGRYAKVTVDKCLVAGEAKAISEVPVNQAVLIAPKAVDKWRIIAGPALTRPQMHCATVPDGPNCQWTDGSYERLEAQNRRFLERHFAELEVEARKLDAAASLNHCSACGRDDDLTDRANPTLCYPCLNTREATQLVTRPIPADLSIPAFLDRRPRLELQEAA